MYSKNRSYHSQITSGDSFCKKTREFECQMLRFSVAPYLTRHSPCLRFPEHLVCLASMSETEHFIQATHHSRVFSQKEFFGLSIPFLN